MQIGSKLAIYKCELIEPPNKEQPKFYKVTVLEKVYNSKKKIGGNWETAFYQGYIFDLSIDLEPAKFDLEKNEKDKYSFDNISNPEKSLIRVLSFAFEKHTRWYGQKQQKNDYGKPILDDIFYIYKIIDGTKVWRSEDGEYKLLQRKFEAQKQKIKEQQRKNLDKDVYYRGIIRQIRAEMAVLEKENKKLEQIIGKQKNFVSEAKKSVKEANKQTMVVRRKNTLANKQIEKTQQRVELEKQKLVEAKKEINKVKRMKKKEVIKQAESFDVEFDDI